MMKTIFARLSLTLGDVRMHLGILAEASFVLVIAGGGFLICLLLTLV
jgi:hypothetical protein